VTQATRVITYRERQDGFDSLDDLGAVPGMPRQFLREVSPKLTL
jgi:DNA uptake protein ComE-like DNA-binding protein